MQYYMFMVLFCTIQCCSIVWYCFSVKCYTVLYCAVHISSVQYCIINYNNVLPLLFRHAECFVLPYYFLYIVV